MNQGKFVFTQIMDRVPWRRFQTCFDRYRGDRNVQTFVTVHGDFGIGLDLLAALLLYFACHGYKQNHIPTS